MQLISVKLFLSLRAYALTLFTAEFVLRNRYESALSGGGSRSKCPLGQKCYVQLMLPTLLSTVGGDQFLLCLNLVV